MVYNNQITGFTAPMLDSVGPWQPFISTRRLLTVGNQIGHYLESPREPLCWDSLEQKKQHFLERTSYMIFGDVGSSKSSFAKINAFEGSAVVNDGHPGRVFAINMREIAGQDEYGMFGLYMDSPVQQLSRRFNVFSDDMGFGLSDHLATAVSMHEASNDGKTPIRYMKLVMRVALAEMFMAGGWHGRRPSVATYGNILLSISKSEAIEHIKNVLREQVSDNSNGFNLNAEVEDGITSLDEAEEDAFDITNIDWHAFAADAGEVASAVLNFKAGEFGDIVGGNESFGMDFGKRFFGLNIAHLDEKVKAFVVEFIMRLKDVAARNHDPRYKFDHEIWDEGHGLWNYRGFANLNTKILKYKRGDSSVLYQLTQDPRDFEGVAYSKLALASIASYGAVVMMKMASPDSIAFLSEYVDLTPLERSLISKLNPGQFGIKFPGHPVQFGVIELNPVRHHLIETDTATIEGLKRRHTYAVGR